MRAHYSAKVVQRELELAAEPAEALPNAVPEGCRVLMLRNCLSFID